MSILYFGASDGTMLFLWKIITAWRPKALRLSVPACTPVGYKTVHRTILLYAASPLRVQVPYYSYKAKETSNRMSLLLGASDGGLWWVKAPTSFVAVCIDSEHHQRGGLKTFRRNVFTFDLR